MEQKKVIVFGAAGFVGSYLTDELVRQGYKVLASDISRFGEVYYKEQGIPYVSIDITKREDFAQIPAADYAAVINLAAVQPANVSEKNFDPRDYINVNVIGTLNILDFCKRSKVGKMIYASSHRNTQGLWEMNTAIKESEGRAPLLTGEYAMFSISETTAQDCVTLYNQTYGLPTILFRLPPVYGYGPHTEIFKEGKPIKTGFQTFIDQAIAGKPIELWGDIAMGRDIIYVKDVVDAFVKAIASDRSGELYNITSGKYLTIKEQAELTAKVFWKEGETPQFIERPEKAHSMDSFLYDNTKAREQLGWTPQYNFEQMLEDIKKEMADKKFEYLLKKRQSMLDDSR